MSQCPTTGRVTASLVCWEISLLPNPTLTLHLRGKRVIELTLNKTVPDAPKEWLNISSIRAYSIVPHNPLRVF